MRVLWVGAGASIQGGYPSALELLSKIEQTATIGVVEEGVRRAWKRFAKFRDSATGTERVLLFSTNPEVVLSVPDLLDAARLADDERIDWSFVKPAVHKLLESQATTSERNLMASRAGRRINREYRRKERRRLGQAPRARDALLHVLDDFFATRHYEDHTVEGYGRRSYLRCELEDLQDGDVVVTTNWDTMVERTLLEEGRWTPFDGYGFDAQLTPVPPDVRRLVAEGYDWPSLPALPSWGSKRSAIRVLKIHGSYGWRTPMHFGPKVDAPGRVYLDHAQFLHHMPLVRPGVGAEFGVDDLCLLWDEAEPESYQADRPLYLYPSYLKQMAGMTLQQVWNEADKALRNASELRVLGASLPDADSAVRALLNPIRYRLSAHAIRVTVDDPLPTTHERWRLFLGDGIISRRRKAGE